MSDSPIILEWDEDGLHIRIDLAAIEDVASVGDLFHGRLDGSQAFALYDEVDANLREWVAEGRAAQRAVAAGVPVDVYVHSYSQPPGHHPECRGDFAHDGPCKVGDDLDALDPSDPKHPDYADSLASGGDARRKEARENG